MPFLAAVLFAPVAAADDPADPNAPAVRYWPAQTETDRRAEIRRIMDLRGQPSLVGDGQGRRSMSEDERRRLREDIRANRDVYEKRSRALREKLR